MAVVVELLGSSYTLVRSLGFGGMSIIVRFRLPKASC